MAGNGGTLPAVKVTPEVLPTVILKKDAGGKFLPIIN
jgi:hypothetical protein